MEPKGNSRKRSRDNDDGNNDNYKGANALRSPVGSGLQLGSEPIAVHVGTKKEKFYVHEHLLIAFSNFFKAALNQNWKEGHEKVVMLPNAGTETFQIFANWVYTGRVFSTKVDDVTRKDPDNRESGLNNKEWSRLFDAYRLGDFLQAVGFKDAIIDALMQSATGLESLPHRLATFIYGSSSPDSAHTVMCVNAFLRTYTRADFVHARIFDLPSEFVMDAFIEFGKHLNHGLQITSLANMMRDGYVCNYHDHVRLDMPCYRTRFGH
ncbi:hypothetical protein NX059_010278 [Plenodomus lindquistii]|nr:hypothetical protein NX059_010278 [Plenodomus lindquistii]